jgi:hypothetical protein
MPKYMATAAMERTRKRRIPHKRWRDEIGENINTVALKAG